MAHTYARLVIVGSGPAGYTAAIYAARAMLEPVLICGFQPGGQLMITTDVENYPGFADVIQGPWLMEQMRLQAEHVGTRMVSDHVVKVELGQRPFRITCDSGDTYTCDALVIATGAQAKWLGLASEARFQQDRLFKNPKISVVWDSAVEEVCGTENPLSVSHVRLRNVKTGSVSELKTDGVFIAIGHKPATELFAGQLDMKPGGYLRTLPDSTATNVPGVYAAGDVSDDVYRQAVTAAGMGCMAALEAERYLAAQEATRQAAE